MMEGNARVWRACQPGKVKFTARRVPNPIGTNPLLAKKAFHASDYLLRSDEGVGCAVERTAKWPIVGDRRQCSCDTSPVPRHQSFPDHPFLF